MVQLIVGNRGKGKTKILIDNANDFVNEAKGNIVYLDKSMKHMYELSNKIRLIDVSPYPVKGYDQLEGFICGILSQDHDIEAVYIDSFSLLSDIQDKIEDMNNAVKVIERISSLFNVRFVLSLSCEKSELSEELQAKVIVAL